MKHHMVDIEVFVEPMFGENALLITSSNQDGSRTGWVIDPSFQPHVDRLVEHARERDINIEKIILTHGHGDHIAGIDIVKAAFPDAELLISAADEPMLRDSMRNLSAPFGVDVKIQAAVDQHLEPGLELVLGATQWRVLDTSGHSPGGRSLYSAACGLVIVGDALFAGSIGRTDFPGANHQQLIGNLRRNLLSLPGDTIVYSGHGPTTTIENERKFNPFLAE
jgi:glyoxylase-like metal-dependent hydrolase (beta-lactamase superfamily II)